jgi:hypothetical protein
MRAGKGNAFPTLSFSKTSLLALEKTYVSYPPLLALARNFYVLPLFIFHMRLRLWLKDQGKKTAGRHSLFPLLIKAVIKPVDPPGTQSCAATRERARSAE